jgi:acetyltransferase-like isoleucine patch superfamily enzyme
MREVQSMRTAINPRFALMDVCANVLPKYAMCGVRARFYRMGGCRIEHGVTIQGPLVLLGSGPRVDRLRIGEGTIVAPFVTFGLDAEVAIGRRVSIGPGAAFHTGTHAIGFASRRMQLATIADGITVEDGAWIGAHSVVLPGVTVGRGSIVSAGAVVTENVPANVLVAGNPATVREALPFANR